MVRRSMHTALSGLLLILSLPFLAVSVLRSACRRSSADRPTDGPVPPPDCAGEFDFERAIPAYEALIDQTVAERRQ